MSAKQFFIPFPTAFNSNGLAVPGAKFYFYLPGTLTLTTIYSNVGLTTPAANPSVANGAGRLDTIYLDSSLNYRLRIEDADGNELEDIDNYVPGTLFLNVTASATFGSITGMPVASTRTALSTLPTTSVAVRLEEDGREGVFKWSSTNHSADVTADPGQGIFVAPSSDTTGASGAWVRDYRVMGVSWFGTVADGTTDDTTAVQRAINMAVRLKVATVFFRRSDNEYKVTNLNIPVVNYDPVGGLQTIEFLGAAGPSSMFGTLPDAAFHMSTAGSIIKTASTTGGALLTVTQTAHGGYNFSWVKLVLRNMGFRLNDNPSIACIDATWAQQFVCEGVMIDTGVFSTSASKPTHSAATAILTPGINNGALTYIRNTHISGFYDGIGVNEHSDIDGCTITCCLNGLRFYGAYHASKIGRIGLFRCPTGITFAGGHGANFVQVDIEHATSGTIDNPADHTVGNGWQYPLYDVNDPSNFWYGDLNWWSVEGGSGADVIFTVNGATSNHANWRRVGAPPTSSSVFLGTAQSIANATSVGVTMSQFSTEANVVINGGDTTQVICQDAGSYRFKGCFAFASNSTGYRRLELIYSSNTYALDIKNAVNGDVTTLFFDRVLSLPAASAVTIKVTQNSGGALSLSQTPSTGLLVVEKIRNS